MNQLKKQQKVRLVLLVLALSLFSTILNAQVELGVKLGAGNYLGDSSPLLPVITETHLAAGAFLNVHLNPKIALKAQLSKYTLSGNDANLLNPATANRGLSFSTGLMDIGLAVEYYPTRFERCDKSWKPYLFAGVSYINYQTISSNFGLVTDIANGGSISESSVSIPFGIGLKKILFKGITLGAELQCAKTFTDQLDFSASLGNAVYKDWYMFGGITLSYVFGKCAQENKVSRNKAVPCPSFAKNIVN